MLIWTNINERTWPRHLHGLSQNLRVTLGSDDLHMNHLRSIYLNMLWHNCLYNYRSLLLIAARICRSSIRPPFSDGVTRDKRGKLRNSSFFSGAKPPVPQLYLESPHPGTSFMGLYIAHRERISGPATCSDSRFTSPNCGGYKCVQLWATLPDNINSEVSLSPQGIKWLHTGVTLSVRLLSPFFLCLWAHLLKPDKRRGS